MKKSEDNRGFSINFLPILIIGFLCLCLFSCNKNEQPRVKTVVKYVFVDSSSVKTRTDNKTEIVTEASKYKKKERKQDIRENNLEGDVESKETVNLAYTIKTDSLFQFDDDYTEVEKTDEGYEIRVKDTLSIIKEVKYKKFLGLKIKKKYEKYHLVSHNPNIDYILSDIIIHNIN